MAALIQFQLSRDANSLPHGVVVKPSQYIDQYVLEANVAETVNIPAGARIAFMTGSGAFYISWTGAVAVVPAADILDGSSPELIAYPTKRDVSGYTNFSIVAGATCNVTIAYYS